MLLDTNVLSELMRPAPSTAVLRWLQAQRHEDLYTSAITVAELRAGVAVLPEGARRRDLSQRLADLLHRGFGTRVAGFEAATAEVYAELRAGRQRMGRPAVGLDLLIAAIAKERGWPAYGHAECGGFRGVRSGIGQPLGSRPGDTAGPVTRH